MEERISTQEQARRQQRAEFVRVSTEMEGGQTSPAARAIQDRYVRGEITADELLELTREQVARELTELRDRR